MAISLFSLIPKRYFSRQASKPAGLFGRLIMTKIFNKGNADINKRVLQTLALTKTDTVLEIGFGPGLLIKAISDIVTEGHIHGIDYAKDMIDVATKTNADAIKRGQITLQLGNSEQLPYPDNSITKVCAVNVIYFWQNPKANLDEIYRVLSPGSKIVIGFRNAEQMQQLDLDPTIFNTYSNQAVLDCLQQSGFIDTEIIQYDDQPLVSFCAIGTKAKPGQPN